ncbi:MAG: uracil-DNA glycosylase [Gemmatimonadota bacterium]
MTDAREPLRRYLEARIALGEPPVILPSLRRGQVLAALTGGGRGVKGPPELARLAREGTAERIRELDFDELREVALACRRCALHEGRQHVVFGEGASDARLVCVGEAPGSVEDETGRPFVGRAGQLLDLMLMSVGLRRDEVYICNVLKCRPPGNRNPQPEEIAACSPFLLQQIDLIDPKVLVAFGSFAAQTLLGTRESIGRLRGRTHLYGRFPLVGTSHPAASLRNPGWKRPTWEDLQIARRVMDGDSGLRSGAPGGELSLDLP